MSHGEDKDPNFDRHFQDASLEKEYPFLNNPYFAQKVVKLIQRPSGSNPWIFYVLQSKYTYLALFLGLVLFPALAEANSLRSLCFY